MYPIKFENVYFQKVWGGRDFEIFRDNLPPGDIGESWDICCHPNGMGIVANGRYRGMTLEQLIKVEGSKLLGTSISPEYFPLLIKLINARDKLSVQVHPNDQYAREKEGEAGKTEAWYIVEAQDGASIVLGTKTSDRKEFVEGLKSNTLDQWMNRIFVKKGEVYFVKSGLIHAIEQGVIIAEIQQNSDTTYRVYDYGRGRELHIDRALEVIDFSIKGEKRQGLKVEGNGYSKTYYCIDRNFSLEVYEVEDCFEEVSDPERFWAFTCVEGRGEIVYEGGREEILRGDSILIPASLGGFTIKGNIKLIKSYVPDVNRVQQEILDHIQG